jgi:hypothetical protein
MLFSRRDCDHAIYFGMTPDEAKSFYERRRKIIALAEQVRALSGA